jgi:hypothetical protein
MTKQREELNLIHAISPEPGDYWDEMCVGICVILEVTDDNVVICKTKKNVDSDHWTWDLSNTTSLSKKEFKKWLEYDTIPNKFWASVNPRKHIWAVEETIKGDQMENPKPVQMTFTIASITQGIQYWLNNVVLRENTVVDKIIFDTRDNVFIVTLANEIQVGKKL